MAIEYTLLLSENSGFEQFRSRLFCVLQTNTVVSMGNGDELNGPGCVGAMLGPDVATATFTEQDYGVPGDKASTVSGVGVSRSGPLEVEAPRAILIPKDDGLHLFPIDETHRDYNRYYVGKQP